MSHLIYTSPVLVVVTVPRRQDLATLQADIKFFTQFFPLEQTPTLEDADSRVSASFEVKFQEDEVLFSGTRRRF